MMMVVRNATGFFQGRKIIILRRVQQQQHTNLITFML